MLTGRRAWRDALSRIAYQTRGAVDLVEVLDFRGALGESEPSSVPRLGKSAVGARDLLLARLNAADHAAGRARQPPRLARVS